MVATGSRSAAPVRARRRLLGNYDLRVGLQFLKAAVGNHVSRIDAFHRRLTGVRDPRLDVADLGRIVLDQIKKRRLPVVLNSGGRDQRDPIQSLYPQPRVDELVGKQRTIYTGPPT